MQKVIAGEVFYSMDRKPLLGDIVYLERQGKLTLEVFGRSPDHLIWEGEYDEKVIYEGCILGVVDSSLDCC